MIKRFSYLSINKKILFASILMITITIVFLGLFIRSIPSKSDSQSTPNKFEYCKDIPKDLCVLSFGRDSFGNATVNFFVPDKHFPKFYLIVKTENAEERFECLKRVEVTRSILCVGKTLSLKQKIEVNILHFSDNRLLAKSSFFVKSFLISTQGPQIITTIVSTETEASTIDEVPTVEIFEESTP